MTRSVDSALELHRREQLLDLLHNFRSPFDILQASLAHTTTVSQKIDTSAQHPLHQHMYRVSSSWRRVITEQVDSMLKRSVVQEPCSPVSSPIVLVQKQDGSVRFCVDYRHLNKLYVGMYICSHILTMP